jgi:hypothetical protein
VSVIIYARFIKSGGTVYGKDEGNNSNITRYVAVTAPNGEDTWGHAVYYSASPGYYRDTTLNPGDNISTATLPTTAGAANTVGNWIMKE